MRDHDHQDDDDTMELPLGDDVVVSAWLDLSVTATYHPSIDDDDDVLLPVEGELEYLVNEYTSPYSASSPSSKSSNQPAEPAILASGTIHNITITNSVADYHLGQIHLPSAKLWWPHTHGSQPLYSIKVVFRSYDRLHSNDDNNDNSTMSPSMHESQSQSTFGIRTISSYTHPKTKSFALRINGHSIFLQGGNWITTDQFLRYSNSPQRYFHELRLLCNVGLNSLRVWGGGIVETQHFYHAADVLGLLIYQEFWMTGDNNGRFAGDYDWPLDHEAYLANARDVMIRMRNHPSLAWYGGGNELYPIPPSSFSSSEKINGVSPPQDIEEGLQHLIAKLDGTRPYVTSSVMEAGDDDTFFDPTRALGPKDGAYGILNEHRFFERNPGLTSPLLSDDEIHRNLAAADVKDKDAPGRNIGFQTETGSVSHPDLDSLQKFLSPEAMGAFPDCGEVSDNGGSVHEEWTYFKYLPFTETSTEGGIDHICAFLYPPSNTSTSNDGSTYRMESIEDYTWAAQLAQYFQYKALFEGYSARMWKWYSAVYIWKASSPAPTFRGALYDWYLSTNGGY